MFIFFLVIVVFMFVFPYMIGHDQKSGTGTENNDTKETTTKAIDCDALIQKYNNKVYTFTTSDAKLQGEFWIVVSKEGDKCTYRRWVSFKLNEQLPSNYATVNRESRSTPQNYIAKVYYKDGGEDGFWTTALFPAFCQKDKMPDPFADWRATDIYTNCSANNSTTTPSDVLYSHRSNESNDMDTTDEEVMKRFFSAYQFDIYDASAFVECKPQEIGGTMTKTCSINFDKTISESSPIRTYTLKAQGE